MSNILKGILKESNSVYGHSDPAREYGAEDPTYRKRGPYSHTDDDDDGNPFAEYERQQRMFAVGRAQKAAKEKAQRDADHDRLATGTNESLNDPWGDQGNFAGDKPFNLGGVSIKNIQPGDTVKYFGQPSQVVAMSKDRKYSRIKISKGMGGVTQDVLTSDLQQLGQGKAIEENDNTRMRLDQYYDLADTIQEKLKQAIQLGNKELVQKLNKERDELDARVKQYGLMPESEQLDEISNEKLSQYKTAAAADASKADSEGDYKRGDKRFSGIVKATKKQFANDTKKSGIGQGISEDRFNSKQEVINHFVKNGKSAGAGAAAWERGWRGSTSKKPVELKRPPQKSYHDELDDKRYSSNTFENLGDQLKSKSLEALTLLKQQIEQKRAEDLAQWEQDFRNNVVNKMRSQPVRPPEATPVAQPGEKHSVLKARLAQLNSAIEKQALLDKLIDKLERRGLMTPAMQNDTDTRMHVRYGAKDNYQSLNAKLDNAIKMLQDRLYIRKKSGLKEGWSQKYKSSINCSHPKGFSQKAHCAGKKKHNESIESDVMEMVCEDCGMCETHVDHENLDEACWKGYHKEGNKKMFGKTYPNCVKNKKTNEEQEVEEGSRIARKPGQPAGSKKHSDLYTDENPKGTITGLKFATAEDARASVSKIRNSGRSHAHKIQAAVAMEQRAKAAGKAEAASIYRKYINATKKTDEGVDLEEACWDTHKQVGMKSKGGKQVPNCVPKESIEESHSESCPHCGGEMVSEELMNEKKDACYYKVKSRYKVWPSAYASGALVKCRKKGASNWGTGGKKNESSILEGINRADESLHDWFNKEKWVRMDTKGKIKGPCAREPGEGKPKCLPQSKAHSLGKKGRASAAQRKRREDPNPERSGKAINVNTKKKD